MSEAMQDRTGSLFPAEQPAAETLSPVRIPARRTYATSVHLTDRDRLLLGWIGEQYTVRADLLAALMARLSSDAEARRRGRVAERVARRRVQGWRAAGLVQSAVFLANTPVTVWLTGDGYRAGLPWRTCEPTQATTAHRHAVGLVRAHAEAMVLPGAPGTAAGDETVGGGTRGRAPEWAATPGSLRWICERDLREGMAGRPTHLPDGVVECRWTTPADCGAPPWKSNSVARPRRGWRGSSAVSSSATTTWCTTRWPTPQPSSSVPPGSTAPPTGSTSAPTAGVAVRIA